MEYPLISQSAAVYGNQSANGVDNGVQRQGLYAKNINLHIRMKESNILWLDVDVECMFPL